MRPGPMSTGRRSWGSIRAVAWLALAIAPACGGSTTAGTRPGSGGTGGGATGSGGNNVTTGAGGSNVATGNGGTNGAAGGGGSSVATGGHGAGGTHAGGTGGQITDAGAPGDARGSFDGGTCIDNGSQNTDPNMTAVSGSFSGALAGTICTGGAFAKVETEPADDGGAPTILFFLQSDVGPDAAQSIRFQSPANATSGLLSAEIGLPSLSPGTYAQAASCGDVLVIAYLPIADPSRCANAVPDQSFQCPDGCELQGLTSCMGIPPQRTYVALGASDCVGNDTTPTGSWTLTLTSLTPGSPDAIN